MALYFAYNLPGVTITAPGQTLHTMSYFPSHIQRVIDGAYDFDFGKYIGDAFSLVGRNAGLFIGFMLIWFAINMTTGLIPFIGPVGYYLVIAPCLTAGFYLAAKKSDYQERLEFGTFFQGFDHIGNLVLVALIQGLISLAVLIPVGIAFFVSMDVFTMDPDAVPDMSNFPWWALLFVLPLIYLVVSWSFAPLLVIFHKMEAWPAMEASRQIISKQWGLFFLLSIVAGFIAVSGVIGLFIGLLFTVPIGMATVYVAFNHIVGVPGVEEEVFANNHFVD